MKQASLAAKTPGALSEMKLPAVFGAVSPPLVPKSFPPYIVFAHHNRSDEWSKLTSKYKDVNEGDMFLVKEGDHIRLDPAKLSWICHRQVWVLSNAAGEVQQASFTELPFPYKETVEAVVLIYLEGHVFPANIQFRTTKCPAAHTMAKAQSECQSPSWGEISPAHKESLAVNQPFGRFYGEVALGPQRTSKSSGLPYRPTTCRVFPTGAAEWRALHELSQHPDFDKMMNEAAARFTERIATFEGKIK
jgi:hypothetical protein